MFNIPPVSSRISLFTQGRHKDLILKIHNSGNVIFLFREQGSQPSDQCGLTLLAGMPLDAFIETGARSPISYLVQPMMEFFMKAWREQ